MLFDTHIHTEFSSDSTMRLDEAVQAAAEKNLGLIVTEHMDLHYPDAGKFVFSPAEYFAKYGPRRSERLLLGVELGMQEAYAEEERAVAHEAPFDYVLGSAHMVEGLDLYYETFYQRHTRQECLDLYFETMAACIRSHPYIDALGHIDYICRYARFDDREIRYMQHDERIDTVLREAVEHDIALEINTRRLGDPEARQALLPIYRRYYALGGRLATIGSDAHDSAAIGVHFAYAQELAQAANLRLVYFRARKPSFM